MDFQEKINNLFTEQSEKWDLLRDNLNGLDFSKSRTINFKGFNIALQYNPKRIRSSGARVDRKSVEGRPCFLCALNRPSYQDQVAIGKDYEVLCNPYPIFQKHFTIAKTSHVPQRIRKAFIEMLDISKVLPELVLFYNGPECGASAPDHLHFQAGNVGLMPIEMDYENLLSGYGRSILRTQHISVFAFDDGLRRAFAIESDDNKMISEVFNEIYQFLDEPVEKEEPMLNILSWYAGKMWRVIVFLRRKHRPEQYYRAGEENILFSPAAVDLGGTMIMPLEKDYLKVTQKEIVDMFQQVSLEKEKFDNLIQHLLSKYNKSDG